MGEAPPVALSKILTRAINSCQPSQNFVLISLKSEESGKQRNVYNIDG